MTKEEAGKIIEKEVYDLCERKLKLLNSLYALPADELREQEKQSLVSLSLSIPHDAGETVLQALQRTGVKYPQTVWGNIKPKLRQISFQYIDWNSFGSDKAKSKAPDTDESYQREVSAGTVKKFRKDGVILVASGLLAVGSVVCLCLKVGATPVWVVGIVTAALASGYVVLRRISGGSTRPPEKKGRTVPSQPKPDIAPVIASVKKANKNIIVNWSKALFSETITAWQEAEKE